MATKPLHLVHRFDNPRLIFTTPRKPPIARGHRTWLEIKPRERAPEDA